MLDPIDYGTPCPKTEDPIAAAKETVIATIKMTLITGDTALLSLNNFLKSICFSPILNYSFSMEQFMIRKYLIVSECSILKIFSDIFKIVTKTYTMALFFSRRFHSLLID